MSALALSSAVFVPRSIRTANQTSSNPVLDALSAIARYIPAEGLGLYVAVAAFTQGSYEYTALAFGAALLLNGLVTGFTWSDSRKKAPVPNSGKPKATVARLILTELVLGILLSVYVSALPLNPLIASGDTRLGGVLVIVVGAFATFLCPRIGLEAKD